MPYRQIFAYRASNDIDKIAEDAILSADRIGANIRKRVIDEVLASNHRFNVKQYIVDTMRAPMVLTSMAAHLTGFRRFRLMLMQNPSLKKRWDEGTLKHPALKLSSSDVLDETIRVLTARTGINLEALQAQYDTNALKILNGIGDDAERQLEETLQNLVVTGSNLRDAKQVLNEKFFNLGIVPQNNFSVENIFRTQTALAFGAGKYAAEQDSVVQEILWGYRYSTVGDGRVRDEHLVLEGTTLPKNDPFWLRFYPPNGWSCRCQAIPIFEQMEIVQPPTHDSNGDFIAPDKGFNFNPGIVFNQVA